MKNLGICLPVGLIYIKPNRSYVPIGCTIEIGFGNLYCMNITSVKCVEYKDESVPTLNIWSMRRSHCDDCYFGKIQEEGRVEFCNRLKCYSGDRRDKKFVVFREVKEGYFLDE